MRIFTNLGYSFIIITLCCCFAATSHAQTYEMVNGTVTTCGGFFTDSGGNNASYGNNEDITMTICPESAGQNIQLIFSGVNILEGDQICFYDNDDGSGMPMTCYHPDFQNATSFIIQATAENPSGCLTINFQSDGANQGAGWSADINCIADCQNIFVDLASSDPAVAPADTGWIDICPGDRIAFSGQGIYPQDGVAYNHSDFTSSFEWDFGDGNSALGPNVTHVYDEPGGYMVQLTITDQMGCTNLNFLNQRVRVATYPEFTPGAGVGPICAGDTLALAGSVGSINPGSIISVNSTGGSFQTAGVVSDSLALPDGNGASYSTSISFTDFAPGQVLTDINDLLGVCVTMEHSWMYDLNIYLQCPNGTELHLQNQEFIGNEVYLGEPIDGDGNPPAQGVGYEYCWTPTSTNGTWTQYAQTIDPLTLPSGDYESFEDMSTLLGCPLNGEWTIEVIDEWPVDNGWIFEWSINFDDELYPSLETYEPEIVDFTWNPDPSIFEYNTDSSAISASPLLGGDALYTFSVTDEYGCVFDTSLTIPVLPFAHPDCYDCVESIAPLNDTTICAGEIVSFNAASTNPPGTVSGFQTQPQIPFGASTNPPSNPLYIPLEISFINPGTLDDPLSQIESVCINILTDWNADLNIFLEAPSGQQIPLSTGNGGGSDNYTNTCFTPDAITPISTGTGPFTGTYQPEGDFTLFTGEVINGQWNLVVTDAFGFNDIGEVISWSITFNSVNEPSYSWQGTGLSCTNCPDPEVSATGGVQEYIVTSLDSYGCTYSDTVTVNVANDIEAPVVDCISSDNASIAFSWLQVGNFNEYEYREIINGVPGAWTGPITSLTHSVNGLSFGDEVTLEVRVYLNSGPSSCEAAIGMATCTYSLCSMTANLAMAPDNVSCFGLADGSAEIVAMNGSTPYTFNLIGTPGTQDNGQYNGLPVGNYAVEVLDALGCIDTVSFEITQPDSLEVSIQQNQPISCFGDATGALTATPQGGNGGYQFEWNTNPILNTASVSSLTAGIQQVVVTDNEGCTATAAFEMLQPDSIGIVFNVTNASCPNTNDGAIQATVSGGTPPLILSWDNGGSGNDQPALTAGTYCVTVEDANGCQKVDCVDVIAPNAISIDSVTTTDVLCNGGNTGTATAHISGGTAPYDYQWNDPLSQTGATANMLSIGNYTVVITDDNGCQIDTNVNVQEPTALSLTFDEQDALCNGASDGSSMALPQGGTEPYSYNWEDGQTSQTATLLSADVYSLTVTDENGCTIEASSTIGEPASAVAVTFEQTVMGCFGQQENELEATATGGTGTTYSYEWSNGQSSPLAVGLDSISYTVTATDENGCEAIASFTPSDLDQIDFLIIDTPPSCFDFQDGRLGINQISGGGGQDIDDYTIEWSTGTTGATAEGLQAGIQYSVTVTSAQGCESVRSRTLQEPQEISFELSVENVACFGDTDGQISVENIVGEFAPYTYNWSNGQEEATALNLASGAYSVTVVDANGCFSTESATVEEPEALSVEFSSEDTPCFGSQMGAIMAAAKGGTPGYDYLWSTGDTQPALNNVAAGTYLLTVTDQNGCSDIITAVIEQPEPLKASFNLQDPSCFGASDGMIEITAEGGSIPYRYSLDGDFFSGSRTLIALGADDYQITIMDANGCTATQSASLQDPPEFVVDAGDNSYTIVLGDSLQLDASSVNGVGLVDYVWEPPYDGTLSCLNCATTVARPDVSILYKLYAIDENGCESTDKVWVYVDKPRVVAVPTGFTPNGDTNNDFLIVHGRAGTMVQYFQVYDRWGELLYEARDFEVNDATAGWDGTYKGEMVNSGVYVWQLVVTYEDGMEESYFGETTLIR
jgi:gliding motility-associated-like protein